MQDRDNQPEHIHTADIRSLSKLSVAERTFGAVTPRRRPEDFSELRRVYEEEVAEQAIAEGSDAADAAPDSDDHEDAEDGR